MKKSTQRVNSSSPLQKSDLPQTTSEKSLGPEESRGATAVSAPAMRKSDLQSIIDRFSQSSPPELQTSPPEPRTPPPPSSQNALEEAAQKVLPEDVKAALACVDGDLASRMVAAQKPSVKALVALKKEHTEHDPDFLHGIHNQLGALSVTKHGNPRGYGFVRSVLKEPRNQFEMLLVTQMLTLHDAAMISAKSLGEARSLDEVNCYGNMFSKLTRSFASHMQTLHQCRSGAEQKVTFNNVSINEGGQAIVGLVSNNPGSKSAPDTAKNLSSPSDQSGATMPIIEPDESCPTIVPRVGQHDEQPARKKRRTRQ